MRRKLFSTLFALVAGITGATLAVTPVYAAGTIDLSVSQRQQYKQVNPSLTTVGISTFNINNTTNESVTVNSLVLTDGSRTTNGQAYHSIGNAFTNIWLQGTFATMPWPVIVGTTSPMTTSVDDPVGTTYTFSTPGLTIPAGQYRTITVLADVRTNAKWHPDDMIVVSSVSSMGQTTGQRYSSGPLRATHLRVVSRGNVRVSVDPTSPPSGQISMGSTGQTLAVWKMSAGDDVELGVWQMYVRNTTLSGNRNVKNLYVEVNGNRIGYPGSFDVNGIARLDLTTIGPRIVIPRGGEIRMTLKADMTTAAEGAVAGAAVTPAIIVASSSQTQVPNATAFINQYGQIADSDRPGIFTAASQYSR